MTLINSFGWVCTYRILKNDSPYKKFLQNSERALNVFLSIANYSAEFMQNQYEFYPAEKKLLFFARDDQNFTLQKKSY